VIFALGIDPAPPAVWLLNRWRFESAERCVDDGPQPIGRSLLARQ
jgi:hypothetical protein